MVKKPLLTELNAYSAWKNNHHCIKQMAWLLTSALGGKPTFDSRAFSTGLW
jgi:hypothetical protein